MSQRLNQAGSSCLNDICGDNTAHGPAACENRTACEDAGPARRRTIEIVSGGSTLSLHPLRFVVSQHYLTVPD